MSGPGAWAVRNRLWLLLGGLVLVVVALRLVLVDDSLQRTARLDPDNPGAHGAQAVARVLVDQGIAVDVARDAAALEDLETDAGTTVLVTSAGNLGESTIQRLRQHAGDARVLLVEPPPGVVDELGLDLPAYPLAPDEPVRARCDDPLLRDLTLEVDAAIAYDGADCFGGDRGGLYARNGRLAVLGAGSILANGEITRADNAAAALRLLGQSPRLVWYVPDPRDLLAADAVSVRSLLPAWTMPGLGLLVLVVAALLVWRSRRLGPLVTEPLPVAVKAIETTQSRGRLYRKVNDRAHAAGVLREAARSRLVRRLHLPGTAAERPEELVAEVQRRTGRPTADLAALLSPHSPAPPTDQDLVTLARQLAELDREVSPRP